MTGLPAVHALTGAYVLDALSPEERAAFEQHLAGCDDCIRDVDELREAMIRLATVTAVLPPPALRVKVLTSIKGPAPVPSPAGGIVVAVRRSRRRSVLVAVAAAAVTVLGGLIVCVVQRESPGPAESSVLVAPDAVSRGAMSSVGGSATIIVSRHRGKIMVSTNGLPVPDAAHSYQVWLIGPRGPQSAGVLPRGGAGELPTLLADISPDIDRIAITTEPVHGSVEPTTPSILRMDLT